MTWHDVVDALRADGSWARVEATVSAGAAAAEQVDIDDDALRQRCDAFRRRRRLFAGDDMARWLDTWAITYDGWREHLRQALAAEAVPAASTTEEPTMDAVWTAAVCTGVVATAASTLAARAASAGGDEVRWHVDLGVLVDDGADRDAPADTIEVAPRRGHRRIRPIRQVDAADCGAACLAMVAAHLGRPVTLAAARRLTATAIDGSSLDGLRAGARSLGFAARAVKASSANLADLPTPAIAHWDLDHWVVIDAVGRRIVRVVDPSLGVRRLPTETFLRRWSGYVVLIGATDAPTPGRRRRRRPWLAPLFRPERARIAIAVAIALLVTALQMAVPLALEVIVDRALPTGDRRLVSALVLAVAGVVAIQVVGGTVYRLLLARAAVAIDGVAMASVATHLLALPMSYFRTRRTGDIQRRLVGLQHARNFLVHKGVVAVTAAAQLVATVAVMATIDTTLTGLFLAVAPVYAGAMRLGARALRPALHAAEECYAAYSSHQIDAVRGIESVKVMTAEDALRTELLDELGGLSTRLHRADVSSLLYEGGVQLVSFAAVIGFLWVGTGRVFDGDLTLGGFVSFSTVLVLANAPIQLLLNLWDELQQVQVILDRVADVFEEEPEQGADRTVLQPAPDLTGAIALEHLRVDYGGDGGLVLDDVTVDIPAGTTVAVVGRSGSGKSTLVRCLAGLLEPTSGTIRFDGVDAATVDHRSLRRQMGVVLQHPYLFATSIARNIAFGEEPDMDRVVWAARSANAHEFVERLPFGYATKVGETGVLLSGGQQQRIAIARAIYGRPPIVILDEATSALDGDSETVVRDNLARVLDGRTSIIIAHRLSSVRRAQLILVLEHGHIVERGRHDELMRARGVYHRLVSQQLDR